MSNQLKNLQKQNKKNPSQITPPPPKKQNKTPQQKPSLYCYCACTQSEQKISLKAERAVVLDTRFKRKVLWLAVFFPSGSFMEMVWKQTQEMIDVLCVKNALVCVIPLKKV